MPKQTTLVTAYELEQFAISIGYNYTKARILIDRFRPCYEVSSYTFNIDEFEDKEEYDDDERAVMQGFLRQFGVSCATLVNS